jgi:hypothetical protein
LNEFVSQNFIRIGVQKQCAINAGLFDHSRGFSAALLAQTSFLPKLRCSAEELEGVSSPVTSVLTNAS